MTVKIYYKRTNAVHIVKPEKVEGLMSDYVSAITNGDYRKFEVTK